MTDRTAAIFEHMKALTVLAETHEEHPTEWAAQFVWQGLSERCQVPPDILAEIILGAVSEFVQRSGDSIHELLDAICEVADACNQEMADQDATIH